tara:strand:- start:670 stop:1497 length:828 start_codon:yes stop_codon:yes gene_type:complete
MRVSPIAFLNSQVPTIPVEIPSGSNIVMRFEDVNTNFSAGAWADTASTPVAQIVTGSATGAPYLNNNGLQLRNTDAARKEHALVESLGTDIQFESFCIVFDRPESTHSGGNPTNYFFDARDANTEATDNGGFFTQKDATAQGNGSFLGPSGSFYAWYYGEGNPSTTDAGATTAANLTNGTGNSEGGTEQYQWFGPTGRSLDENERVLHFNCNPSAIDEYKQIQSAAEGMYFASNDLGGEASSMRIYAIIYWDVPLTFADFQQLVGYFQSEGTIPT